MLLRRDECGELHRIYEPMTNIFIKSLVYSNIGNNTAINTKYYNTPSSLLNWMDESVITDTVYKLNNKNNLYSEATVELIRNLSNHSNNGYMLLESFADYHTQADQIIKEFLLFMENKTNEFCNTVEAYIASDEDLNSHKKELLDEEYGEFSGYSGMFYNFTISDSIPNVSAIEDFSASLFDNLFKTSISDLSVDAINNAINSADLEADYRIFRGKCLNTEPLSEIEFGKALRQVYRNNNDDPEKIVISKSDIKNIAERYFNFSSNLKTPLLRNIRSMADHVNHILEKIEAICRSNNGLTVAAFTNLLPGDIRVKSIDGKTIDSEGIRMSGDMMLQLDLFCKLKLDQLQKYTDILALAFSAKMDAIKELVEQDRMILIKVCEYITNPSVYSSAEDDPETDLREKVYSDSKEISMGLDL